ncbi:MAG: hypothetical protein KAT09_04710, partial [Candidatus Aegiribacteria sp.]|nr:hypothetical protein [Candidatus Aegiribacteria sp.]
MKFVISLLILTAVAAANPGPLGEGPGISAPADQNGTDGYEITVLNTFETPYTTQILGLDYNDGFNSLLLISNAEDKLYDCSADDGTELNSYALDPANGSSFGMADGGTYAHVNDFDNTDVYFFNGSVWGTYTNPYNTDGRGMDFDGTYVWEAFGPYTATYGAACAFDQTGVLLGSWNLPGITTQLSGLAVFDTRTDAIVIAVTAYWEHFIWFYEFSGSSMTLLGSAPLPVSADIYLSLGLCYSSERDTFFLSYKDNSSVFHISELQITETS